VGLVDLGILEVSTTPEGSFHKLSGVRIVPLESSCYNKAHTSVAAKQYCKRKL